MLIRISLIVAIIAALAVGVLNFVQVKEKIELLVADRNNERSMKEQAQTELAQTRDELDQTTAKLKRTETTLAETTAERDRAQAEANNQTKRAADLQERLSQTTVERDDARAELAAYQFTGYGPEQISALGGQIRQAQEALEVSFEEKRILERKLQRVQNELARFTDPEYVVPLPANLRGTVLVCDPKWEFVILDVGEEHGMLPDGELLVNRNGKLVAKVRVRSVQKDRSIANVMPGWKLGDLLEGDQVIPAHPAS